MLASAGIPWTIIPVDRRDEYTRVLDNASVRGDIKPFAGFVADCAKHEPPHRAARSLAKCFLSSIWTDTELKAVVTKLGPEGPSFHPRWRHLLPAGSRARLTSHRILRLGWCLARGLFFAAFTSASKIDPLLVQIKRERRCGLPRRPPGRRCIAARYG
jgi:hypothetical protein